MIVTQTAFRAALSDAALPVPPGLTDAAGQPAGRRYAVYRNNVAVGLSDALEQAFPVIRKLVGVAFFRAMAGVFVRAHPPQSPLMMFYGAEFPGFLMGFPPVAHLPYLPDVARLELALRASYHAADADPIAPAALAELPPDALEGVRLALAPAVGVLTSAYPILSIWRANTQENAPPPTMRPEAVLIARPALDPIATALTAPEAAAISALQSGTPLAQALDGVDAAHVLGLLLSQSAITGILS